MTKQAVSEYAQQPERSVLRHIVELQVCMQVRRPPVGGGSHMDEEDQFPAAQRDQPAHVQEGTEGFKVSSLPHNHHMQQFVRLQQTGACLLSWNLCFMTTC